MLVAATGRDELELLDEGLLDLARKLLREEIQENTNENSEREREREEREEEPTKDDKEGKD
jgi:hypothetical protein